MLLLEVPLLLTLSLPLRDSPACIPSLFYLVHLDPPLPMQRARPTLAFKPLTLFPPLRISSLCTLLPHSSDCFSVSHASYPDSLRVFQSNAGGLQARSVELLHFVSSHPVDLFRIQESNLNSSSSFRIPEFSARRSDRTHSRSDILFPDNTHASGGVIVFVRQ